MVFKNGAGLASHRRSRAHNVKMMELQSINSTQKEKISSKTIQKSQYTSVYESPSDSDDDDVFEKNIETINAVNSFVFSYF
jgi:hypothetical protein